MMTYQEAAQNIVNLYADYVNVCALNDEGWRDYSEEIVIAVEALLIRANDEKQKAMLREYQSQLNSIASTPAPSVNQWVEEGLKLSEYPATIY